MMWMVLWDAKTTEEPEGPGWSSESSEKTHDPKEESKCELTSKWAQNAEHCWGASLKQPATSGGEQVVGNGGYAVNDHAWMAGPALNL